MAAQHSQYSSINEKKGDEESRPLVETCDLGTGDVGQIHSTHVQRRPSYQNGSNASTNSHLPLNASMNTSHHNSVKNSSHSLEHPLRDVMMKSVPISGSGSNDGSGSLSSLNTINTTTRTANGYRNSLTTKIIPSREKTSTAKPKTKNPKSLISHLSYIMSSDDNSDGFEERFQNHDQRTGVKRGLVLLTIVFVLGTVAHRRFSGEIPGSTIHTANVGPSNNHDAIMSLKDSASVSNITNGAVASDSRVCSEMGLSILRDHNGNAVDAAVTTALCLGLVNPASSGIGGGAFILIHSAPRDKDENPTVRSTEYIDRRERPHNSSLDISKKITEVIDCRESAPGNATFDMYEELPPAYSTTGALSIAVPGELRGLELAHERYGRLSWEQIMQPVINLAEKGVHISAHLAKDISASRDRINQFPHTKQILTKNSDGKTYLKAGQKMARPKYANTLKNVALNGADYVYKGEVAATIAEEIQAGGGIISSQDIEEYKPIIRDPVIANVDGFNVVSVPPPSSGGATIIGILRFLSGYSNPFATFEDTLSIHRLVEAFKHVFAIRMSMSDPDYFTNITSAAVKDLISGPLMEQLRKQTLDDGVLPLSHYGGKWALLNDAEDKGDAKDFHEGDRQRRRRTRLFNYLEDHGTTSLSVVDKDRNSVSITSSVNIYFGSGFTSPSTGIIFNDVMDDFATPGRPNAYGTKT